jgi:DNA polymerase (family 10)
MKVDLRIVAPDQFGNLLQHFTGSKNHNMALREAAVRRGLHVSEYGVLDDATGETLRCTTEEEVYAALGYAWIPPELREDRGELQAAANGGLPELLPYDALKGDLHCHTVASDGRNTIPEMARAARELGYEYLAITDHSTSVAVRIEAAQLSQHVARIRQLSGTEAVGGITLLAGSEVNILPDGSLDYDDENLAGLDWVVASVHSSFQMDSAAMTARIVRAISNPLVDVIGHLSGRKIERRPPYHFDLPAIVEAARETGTMLEINSSPDRRDMNEVNARAAAEAGVPVVINCDAHRVGGFEVARYGVATAWRAWLEPDAVVNTRPWDEVAALRPRARASG